jgi:50S ribosomal protein L16 3-hydroxylase
MSPKARKRQRPAAKARQSPALTGQPGLGTLFAPLSAAEFLKLHFPDRPCVQHGPPERLGALADMDAFADFRRWPRIRDLSIIATLTRPVYRRIRVDPEQAAQLYGVGATLSFNGVHLWHPTLGEWVGALAEELGVPGDLCHSNVYVSPKGGGLPKHFDSHAVIIVHLIGQKTWFIAPEPDVRNPLENQDVPAGLPRKKSGELAMPRGAKRIEMRPGSVIFVPAGFGHQTRAGEASVSVTFGLRTHLWLELVRDAVATRLARFPEWREPAWGAGGSPAQRARAVARFAQLLTGLQSSVGALEADDILQAVFPRAETLGSTGRS